MENENQNEVEVETNNIIDMVSDEELRDLGVVDDDDEDLCDLEEDEFFSKETQVSIATTQMLKHTFWECVPQNNDTYTVNFSIHGLFFYSADIHSEDLESHDIFELMSNTQQDTLKNDADALVSTLSSVGLFLDVKPEDGMGFPTFSIEDLLGGSGMDFSSMFDEEKLEDLMEELTKENPELVEEFENLMKDQKQEE